MYTTEGGRISPIDSMIIIGKLSLTESDESLESQRNKDVVWLRLRLRLVKYVLPFTLIRNTVAIETHHETVTMCGDLLAFQSQDSITPYYTETHNHVRLK